MNEKRLVKISKKLSFLLRHQPEAAGLELSPEGWVSVTALLEGFSQNFFSISLSELEEVVAKNNKKRFAFNSDKSQIRASQGHSVNVNLGYEAQEPPAELYHGTASRYLKSIRQEGLKKQNRHHVHLSSNTETAKQVGSRHGVPVVLKVYAAAMHREGYTFFVSENGVWLVEAVPSKYLHFQANWQEKK